MHRFLWVFFMVVLLVSLGCESQEQQTTKTAPQQAVKAEKTVKAEESKATIPAIEVAKAVADQAQEHVEETAKAAESVVEDVSKSASTVIEETIEVTEETSTKVVEQVTNSVAEATSTVAAANEVAVPAEVTIEASYGNVTMPHGMHADSFECSTCHGDGTPAAFELTKESAHALCKGCHKAEGTGPTGCSI